MTEITNKQLKFVFKKLGVEETSSGGHIRGWVMYNGRPVQPLRYSHAKPLNGWAAESFIKVLKMNKAEFAEFLKCTFTREEVVRRLLDGEQ